MARERRGVFGEAVAQYQAARPGYPEELVTDVLRYAGTVHRALEVGAGTGKGTVAFARRGVNLTCLEPDPRMAAELARQCATFPSVDVVVAPFETWEPSERFDVLLAAQSWHWVDDNVRWDLARTALKEGGAMALFWNVYTLTDVLTRDALLDIDRRYQVDALGHTPSDSPFHDFDGEIELTEGWPAFDLADDARFTDFISRRYRREQRFSTALYLDFLSSLSAYRMIDDDQRNALLRDVARVLERRGGTVSLRIATDLFMCRVHEGRK
ncbi:MAG TPA: class I SAM-dependent methyltransferase [Acidimicrobiales bacterium]|nr:class I SAM-dependent methyltransferase [Acidimicrobiales bacterium]